MAFLDFFRKIGLLRSGGGKGTYKNAAEAPSDRGMNNEASNISNDNDANADDTSVDTD